MTERVETPLWTWVAAAVSALTIAACDSDCTNVCPLDDPGCELCNPDDYGHSTDCDPMDAEDGTTGCSDAPIGYAWDGEDCFPLYCDCVGNDCDRVESSQSACLVTFNDC